MIEPGPITVYTANTHSGGLFRTAVRSVRDIHTYRFLIWTLFSRDFRAQFKQSLLGYFWAALGPLLGVFSFVFMNYAGILNPGPTPVPYPVYAFVGTSLWGFLMTAMGAMSSGLNAQSDLIMRTNIPKIALVASAFANILYGLLVNLVLVVLFLLVFRVHVGWISLAFPLLLLPLIILGTGVGLMVSVLGIIARDISRIVSHFFGLAMFMTPVFFVADHIRSPILHRLIMANPLTYLIEVPRQALLAQPILYWWEYLVATGACLVILLIGIKVFDMIQDLVAERM